MTDVEILNGDTVISYYHYGIGSDFVAIDKTQNEYVVRVVTAEQIGILWKYKVLVVDNEYNDVI